MMRLAILAMMASGGLTGIVQAAPMRSGPQETCIAGNSVMHRAAATVAGPTDCCTGHMRCSQYLSTSMIIRPAPDKRT
jgi:hypothetical protein